MRNQRTRGRRVAVALATVAAALITAAPLSPAPADAAQQCPSFGNKTVTGTVSNGAVREASGIAASLDQPGVLWIHNDSGNPSDLYAVNASGTTLMTVKLDNVPNWDYEDIAIGPGPDATVDYLYIADIGANARGRDKVRIFRLKEPKVTSGTITIQESQVERFLFSYENPGPGQTWNRNAESLAVDPVTGDVVIVEKENVSSNGKPNFAWVYRIRQHELVEGETILAKAMTKIRYRYNQGSTPPTAAEFSPDGKVLFVKNNTEISAWSRDADESIFEALAADPETDCHWVGTGGEAITVSHDGEHLFAIREGKNAEITRVGVTLPAPGLTCDGIMVTIAGTGGADALAGTARRDIIHGRGGADTIEGKGGGDVICGGGGGDTILGNAGGDVVLGDSGNDDIRGGPGADALLGGAGHDQVRGNGAKDTLWGNAGDDTLRGGAGYDKLFGGPGNDTCLPGGGGGQISC